MNKQWIRDLRGVLKDFQRKRIDKDQLQVRLITLHFPEGYAEWVSHMVSKDENQDSDPG